MNVLIWSLCINKHLIFILSLTLGWLPISSTHSLNTSQAQKVMGAEDSEPKTFIAWRGDHLPRLDGAGVTEGEEHAFWDSLTSFSTHFSISKSDSSLTPAS